MIPGKVIGRLVPNQILPCFRGVRFLIVETIDEDRKLTGKQLVAADAIGANMGEFVFMAQGNEATIPLPEHPNPADITIVAIIDEVTA